MRFGIICAMPEEIKELTAKLSDKQEKKIGVNPTFSVKSIIKTLY